MEEFFEWPYLNVNPDSCGLGPVDHFHLNWVFDLETLGLQSNAVTTEISAVGFDLLSGEVVSEITLHIDIESQLVLGRTVTASTLAFWLRQSEEARAKLLLSEAEHCRDNLAPAPLAIGGAVTQLRTHIIDASAKWASENKERSPEPLVWGNGITFDLGKTISLFETTSTPLPWKYFAERDARTYCGLAPNVKRQIMQDFQGVPHYGLDDCKTEIRYLSIIYQLINKI